jgi:hypothetical protein
MGGGAGTAGSAGGAGAAGAGGGEPTVCDGDCIYVRAGGNGDGSDWAQARPALPSSLDRGTTYFVAAGTYPGYTFDDAAVGQEVITVKKATADDHGTDNGWQASFGTGKAVFGPLSFQAPWHVIDGGPGRGLVTRGEFQSPALIVEADRVTVRRVEVDGAFGVNASGQHDAGSCNAVRMSNATQVIMDGCDIHDAADDGIVMRNLSDSIVRNTQVHHLHGCGTDAPCVGPCYNGHSDGFELYTLRRCVLEGNFVHHVKQTSTLYFPDPGDPSKHTEDLLIVNNIFYAGDTGLIAYLQRAKDLRVFHNVFWGTRKGNYGGLAIGPDLTGLRLHNNIILSINLSHTGTTYDPAKYQGDCNLLGVDIGQFPMGPHDFVAGNPLFSGIPDLNGDMVAAPSIQDFLPQPGSPAIGKAWPGDATHAMPTIDMLGKPRVGAPDTGPLERQ